MNFLTFLLSEVFVRNCNLNRSEFRICSIITITLMQRFISGVTRSVGATVRGNMFRPVFQKGFSRASSLSYRTFAISRAANEAKIAVKEISNKGKARAFFKGASFTLGGLTFAGFMGYVNDPRDVKEMRELKGRLEAIRKNYPSVRSFPVLLSCIPII